METRVVHNKKNHRYEIWVGEIRVGLAEYSVMPGERHFVHTEVNPEHQGKSYAATLMKEIFLDMSKNSKDKVVPVCSYVVTYMQRHPEAHDLLKGSMEDAVAACKLPKGKDN
jgi:predicted GNAT family acetyltransferase